MSKLHFLVTNFQKSPNTGGSPLPARLTLRYWWPEYAWFGLLCWC